MGQQNERNHVDPDTLHRRAQEVVFLMNAKMTTAMIVHGRHYGRYYQDKIMRDARLRIHALFNQLPLKDRNFFKDSGAYMTDVRASVAKDSNCAAWERIAYNLSVLHRPSHW